MNTPTRILQFSALLSAAVIAMPRPATAQISPYVVMAGDQGMFHVIQGGVLVRSWPVPAGSAQRVRRNPPLSPTEQ